MVVDIAGDQTAVSGMPAKLLVTEEEIIGIVKLLLGFVAITWHENSILACDVIAGAKNSNKHRILLCIINIFQLSS